MSFLWMLSSYVIVFTAAVSVYWLGLCSELQKAFIGRVLQKLLKALRRCVPPAVRSCCFLYYERIFLTRNSLFQLFYVVLVLIGYAVLVNDILPLLYTFQPQLNHVFWPLVLLLFNSTMFCICSFTNPGVIDVTNHSRCMKQYRYDGQLFKQNVRCSTCSFIKPARSKHCAYCNHCVMKFDHHCVWTNQCIGQRNHSYFVMFMISTLAIICNGISQALHAVNFISVQTRLLETKYIDAYGVERDIDVNTMIQHLFMTYPRIIFLITQLGMLAFLVGSLLTYHIYLAATNQTTNERYKAGHNIHVHVNIRGQTKNEYDKGLAENLREFMTG